MVEQPHTLLDVVQLVHDTIVDAVCDRTCDAYRGPNGSACVECTAHAVTRRLSGAGYLLLPPGGHGSIRLAELRALCAVRGEAGEAIWPAELLAIVDGQDQDEWRNRGRVARTS